MKQTLKTTGIAMQMRRSNTTLPVRKELMSPNWELMLCMALASISERMREERQASTKKNDHTASRKRHSTTAALRQSKSCNSAATSPMSLSTQSAKRRTSFIESETNPFEVTEDGAIGGTLVIENLADTVKIEPNDLDVLISTLDSLRSHNASFTFLLFLSPSSVTTPQGFAFCIAKKFLIFSLRLIS
jgi:hypothetical protein